MRGGRRSARGLALLGFAAAIVAALCACAMLRGASGTVAAARAPSDSSADGRSGSLAFDGPGLADDVASGLAGGDGEPIAHDEGGADSFLEELDAGVSRGEGTSRVAWRSNAGLVELGQAILGAYEKVDGAGIVTSGYLDLEGRVYAAIVVVGDRYVDVIAVEDEGDACAARIVRLSASGLAG